MQKFSEMITAHTVVWPSSCDNATKALIEDWFWDRECCDKPTMFNLFFKRALNKSLPHYYELLKIEPGQEFVDAEGHTKIVSYDWLVKNYRARMVETSGTGATTKILTGSGGVTRTITNDGGETVTMYGSDMEHKGQIVNRGVTDSKTEAVEKSGSSQTVSESASSTDYESHTDYDASASGSHSDSGTDTSVSLAKGEPQSISYGSAQTPQSGLPTALNWSYPGSQAEGKNTNSSSGTTSETSGSDTDVDGSSDTSASASSATGTMGSENREVAGYRQDNSTDETERQFGTQRTTEKVQNGGSTIEDVKDTEDSEETSSENAGVSKEQESGRDIDIATLLEGAKRFIMGSDAWDYLYREVDKCFIGVTMEW